MTKIYFSVDLRPVNRMNKAKFFFEKVGSRHPQIDLLLETIQTELDRLFAYIVFKCNLAVLTTKNQFLSFAFLI